MVVITEQKDISCDFCNANHYEWVYPVDDFTQEMDPASNEEHDVHMLGSWLACNVCHEYIEAGEHKELVRHSLDSYNVPKKSKVYSAVKRRVEQLHDEFYFRRSGEATHQSEDVVHDEYVAGIVQTEVIKE